jgi:hypothetical protein
MSQEYSRKYQEASENFGSKFGMAGLKHGGPRLKPECSKLKQK